MCLLNIMVNEWHFALGSTTHDLEVMGRLGEDTYHTQSNISDLKSHVSAFWCLSSTFTSSLTASDAHKCMQKVCISVFAICTHFPYTNINLNMHYHTFAYMNKSKLIMKTTFQRTNIFYQSPSFVNVLNSMVTVNPIQWTGVDK